MPVTEVTWVTRERTTVRHVRGLLEGLEKLGALDYAEVRILTVSDEQAVDVWGQVVTVNNLPPQGLLFSRDDETPD